jgi:hypothetical protein
LPFRNSVAVKNTLTLVRERGDGLSDAVTLGLTGRLVWGALVGELLATVALFATGGVPPVLIRSLQLFLRF